MWWPRGLVAFCVVVAGEQERVAKVRARYTVDLALV